MTKKGAQKKICSKGHTFYKSSDCPTCPICEQNKSSVGVFGDMPSPVRRALERAGIKSVKQLSAYTQKEILDLHGVGHSSLPLFKKKLKDEGLSFRGR